MNSEIAFCGLDCSKCQAFIATKNNDAVAKMAVVEKWSKEYGIQNLTLDAISCTDCHSLTGPLCGHCQECEIRACGLKRGVDNCAYCLDFDFCEKLASFLQQVPVARENLLSIRATF